MKSSGKKEIQIKEGAISHELTVVNSRPNSKERFIFKKTGVVNFNLLI